MHGDQGSKHDAEVHESTASQHAECTLTICSTLRAARPRCLLLAAVHILCPPIERTPECLLLARLIFDPT